MFDGFRKNRGGATQLQMHARAMGLEVQGRSEAGWAAQRQRQNDASAIRNAATTERRAVEATAVNEHASLDADQAATALTLVGALRVLTGKVPTHLYETLSLVHPHPPTPRTEVCSHCTVSHFKPPLTHVCPCLSLQSCGGSVRATQIQDFTYNFTRKENPSYREAVRLEQLHYDARVTLRLQALATSAEGTDQRLQLQVPRKCGSLAPSQGLPWILALTLTPTPTPASASPTRNTLRRCPRSCCIACDAVVQMRRRRQCSRSPSHPLESPLAPRRDAPPTSPCL